jgi:flagellin-like hook-associated protein FlgL
MKLPFKGDFKQTQAFGVNPSAYAKFGLKGHNGLDHAVPTGTPLYAMISGTVIEAINDTTGYGLYVKIENDKEGALVGHMKSFSVKAGDKVVEGQTLIGYSNNTGNSSGPHTHTGYFPKPRDRNNGYGGYIDFTNLLKGTMSDEYGNMVWKSTQHDGTVKYLYGDKNPREVPSEEIVNHIGGLRSRITTLDKELGTLKAEVENREEQTSRLKTQVSEAESEIKDLRIKLSEKIGECEDLAVAKGKQYIELKQALGTIESLKEAQTNGEVTLTIRDIFSLILNQKITIKK